MGPSAYEADALPAKLSRRDRLVSDRRKRNLSIKYHCGGKSRSTISCDWQCFRQFLAVKCWHWCDLLRLRQPARHLPDKKPV